MHQSKMKQLAEFGQSLWLDNINRTMIESGDLKNRIANGLRGMTSNPAIFNQSISSSEDYDEKIIELKKSGKSTFEIYDELTIKDIQDAADEFKVVYDQTNGLDGYVSLEINPQLANDTQASIDEGLRLAKQVNRKNLMIKVPATDEGFPVVEELLANGLNVNVTLIFSQEQYVKTAQSYINGLKRLSEKTNDLSPVRSVASVFVSRIDTAVDKLIDDKSDTLNQYKGKAAVANSRIVLERSREIFNSPEFLALKEKGANVQRVLWASTGTKNPEYSDIKYIAELITPNSVNTVPEKTLNAYLNHGEVKEALVDDVSASEEILDSLRQGGIDISDVCSKLLADGVVAFEKAFDSLFEAIEEKAEKLRV